MPEEHELDEDQMAMLRKCFAMFDSGKKGRVEKEKIRTILNTLGANFDPDELDAIIIKNDPDAIAKVRQIKGLFFEKSK